MDFDNKCWGWGILVVLDVFSAYNSRFADYDDKMLNFFKSAKQ